MTDREQVMLKPWLSKLKMDFQTLQSLIHLTKVSSCAKLKTGSTFVWLGKQISSGQGKLKSIASGAER